MNPVLVERIEGAVFFLLAFWLYYIMGASWWFFALCILLPDISMLGYMRGPKWGARMYNLGHTYTLPVALMIAGYLLNEIYVMSFAIIWFAHIGADRALGYGLKHESGFKDTHLGTL